MPLHRVPGSNKLRYTPARPLTPRNLIVLNRNFLYFDGRCDCGGLIFAFREKTLYWDLITDEDREHARKRAEKGAPLNMILEENPWTGIEELTVGQCEKCGRQIYFEDPEK